MAAMSSARERVSAHQPSRVGIRRVAPPAEMRPRRCSPSSAARPVKVASGVDVHAQVFGEVGGDAGGAGQHRRP